tara:strand:- start:13355 stop:16096 length:2742 start_codon:yes stop_codon:yes gene_type:complete
MGQSDLSLFGEEVEIGGGVDMEMGEKLKEIKTEVQKGFLELAVFQINYTLRRVGDVEKPIIHIFGRTIENEAEHVIVHGFRPYLYTLESTFRREVAEGIPGVTGWERENENGEDYISIKGERLVKIYGQTPRDVGKFREEFDHYEADILFPNRFLIDKDIGSGIRIPERRNSEGDIEVGYEDVVAADVSSDLRINTFDIEVEDRNGFPENGEETILCISSHDSYTNEYIAWIHGCDKSDVDVEEHLLIDKNASASTYIFETEEEMLEAFIDYIEETDPDVLTGWNFVDFDISYFVARLKKLDKNTEFSIDFNRLSRIEEVWENNWRGPNIKGRIAFDLLYAYRRTNFSELESYRLDAVAMTELGIGKERYIGTIGALWETDPSQLLRYNIRDVELCVEIDRKQGIIPFWKEVAAFVGCKLEDATTPGDTVDMLVLHKVRGKFVLPSKRRAQSEDYEGGQVLTPTKGVREMVAVLDLKSLYPMCMVTLNASPETKVGEQYDGEIYTAPNGQVFRREPIGIIREMVDGLLKEREGKKEQREKYDRETIEYDRFDRQQAAVKVIMNSLYGVLGWERFRLYDKDMADAVTATGREVIRHTQKIANELGYNVAYGDTDSIMLELKSQEMNSQEVGEDLLRENALETAIEIQSKINESYGKFAKQKLNADDHHFEIEFEKLYRRFFQTGRKKRYAGHIIWKDGRDVDDIDIVGFEYRRSDNSPITRMTQQAVIEKIVRGRSLDEVKKYIQNVIKDFEKGNLDIEEIGIPGGIGKKLEEYETEPAHIRGAKYANAVLGTNFDRGSKPKRVYLKRVDSIFFENYRKENSDIFPAEGEITEDQRGLTAGQRQKRKTFTEFQMKQDVISFEFADQIPDSFVIDWELMLEKDIKGPIERILDGIDMSWEEIRSGQQQTGLGQYM